MDLHHDSSPYSVRLFWGAGTLVCNSFIDSHPSNPSSMESVFLEHWWHLLTIVPKCQRHWLFFYHALFFFISVAPHPQYSCGNFPHIVWVPEGTMEPRPDQSNTHIHLATVIGSGMSSEFKLEPMRVSLGTFVKSSGKHSLNWTEEDNRA